MGADSSKSLVVAGDKEGYSKKAQEEPGWLDCVIWLLASKLVVIISFILRACLCFSLEEKDLKVIVFEFRSLNILLQTKRLPIFE